MSRLIWLKNRLLVASRVSCGEGVKEDSADMFKEYFYNFKSHEYAESRLRVGYARRLC